VHIWDYCRDEVDRLYIKNFTTYNANKYKLFTRVEEYTPYKEAYDRISSSLSDLYKDDDILVKCDDDIVYIDVKRFDHYINRIKDNGLYYPNVVNNDVSALIQHYHNVHSHIFTEHDVKHWQSYLPLSDWYTKPAKAIAIHTDFTENRKKYSIQLDYDISYRGRISINFIGGKYSLLKQYFEAYVKYGEHDDESFLSYEVYDIMKQKYNVSNNQSNFIVPSMVVAHFAFAPQELHILEHGWFLEVYQKIADELHDKQQLNHSDVQTTIMQSRFNKYKTIR